MGIIDQQFEIFEKLLFKEILILFPFRRSFSLLIESDTTVDLLSKESRLIIYLFFGKRATKLPIDKSNFWTGLKKSGAIK